MKGIILAAGRGKRMGKLTQGSHKALVNIHGRKLLDIQISFSSTKYLLFVLHLNPVFLSKYCSFFKELCEVSSLILTLI